MEPVSSACVCVLLFIMLGSGVVRHKCVFEFSGRILSTPEKINLRLVDSQGEDTVSAYEVCASTRERVGVCVCARGVVYVSAWG